MNRNHFWKFILIITIVAWSLYEMYPPTARNFIEYFQDTGVHRDATFAAIVHKAEELQKVHPDRTYNNLVEAIGTNDIAHYFPMYDVEGEPHPTTYVLNRLQRDSAGRIKLGIDLAGGTSFLVEMDTNALATVETTTNAAGKVETVTNAAPEREVSGALSQAVEVLRKRVDRFGVAEPVIQPEGADRILIQLPGLSESVKSNTMATLQKPAYPGIPDGAPGQRESDLAGNHPARLRSVVPND